MRVISGTARSLILKTPKGTSTRPTTDKIKETLFNMISNEIYDSVFLDLFAGSGGIGIEALSRGAREAYFCDIDREAIQCIRQNLEHTKLADKATVLKGSFEANLEKLKSLGKKFDIVFIDPPYQKGFEFFTLNFLKTSRLISEETLIIIEMSKNTSLEEIDSLYWYIFRIKEYKNNKHIFIRRRNESSSISGEF